MSSPGAPRGSDPVERFLHRLHRFEPQPPEARDGLRRLMQRGPLVSAYQELDGDSLPDVSIVLTGWVCHFRLLDNGRRQITSIMLPGDFTDFGFLAGKATQVQFVATAPSQLGRIRLGAFAELAEKYPAIMRGALKASATEAAISRERVISLGLRTAIERVSHLLCELWYRLSAVGLVSGEQAFDLPMTQVELGAALGLSTVHVNRTVQALRRSGVITLQGGKVLIHDARQLASIAGFDPNYLNGVRAPGPPDFS